MVMRVLWVIGFCLVLATSLWAAEPGYVSDAFEITVRSGPGMDRKIFAMNQFFGDTGQMPIKP